MHRPTVNTTGPASMLGLALPSFQGLTLVHFSAQRKHVLWDTMGLRVELVTLNGSG